MEEIQLADQLGLDVFGMGKHYRHDYAVSSPATILAVAEVLTMMVHYIEYCPQAKFVMFEHSGHNPQVEELGKLFPLIENFLH
jgi:hypothetical protein